MKKSLMIVSALLVAILLGSCDQPTGGDDPPPAWLDIPEEGARKFWVNDTTEYPGIFIPIGVDSIGSGTNYNLYLRNIDKATLTTEEVNILKAYGTYFQDNSWGDVTTYVQEPVHYFDEPVGVVNIVFYKAEEGVAGYFWSKDFWTDADAMKYGMRSNETNVFYMNIDAAIDATDQDGATLFTQGTLTHEFQHMCNAQYFWFGDGGNKEREMDSWANELCSTTMESIHANQFAIYTNYLTNDTAGNYANGRTDFIHWDNEFNQYATTAMLGGYILSQIDPAKRPAFIQTFLACTFEEDPTPLEYTGTLSSDVRTSIDDLMRALQDPAVDYDTKVTGWVQVDNLTNNTAVVTDWNILMKGFLTALAKEPASYTTYLASVTPGYSTSFTFKNATAGATSIPLKASGFIIGHTSVADINSTKISDASNSGTPAYILAWNGSAPSFSTINSRNNVLGSGTATFVSTDLVRPEYTAFAMPSFAERTARDKASTGPRSRMFIGSDSSKSLSGVPSGRAALPGEGDNSNPGDGITDGHLYCAYVNRP